LLYISHRHHRPLNLQINTNPSLYLLFSSFPAGFSGDSLLTIVRSEMASELTFRGQSEAQPEAESHSQKSTPPPKPWMSPILRPIHYILREQRLLCVLAGISIAAVIFSLLPSGDRHQLRKYDFDHEQITATTSRSQSHHNRHSAALAAVESGGFGIAGRIPLGLKRKPMRIVVTGGAGFVGSHLVDRLMERGDSVIVVDNFFTGRKENVMHHFKNPRFEMIRHDVVEPLLLEVDQIYHLACPASPVHYKYNPVKTIKTNVVGTLNMLGLAKRVGARFLLTSTSEVYGDPLQHPQVETYWGNVNPIGNNPILAPLSFILSSASIFWELAWRY
ncbi:UDP-glucuronic acid decarboxylase 4, partial [Linum grandiflorum]